jgi:cytochrome P450
MSLLRAPGTARLHIMPAAVLGPTRKDFDPLSQEYLRDPMAAYQQIHSETPVFFIPQMGSWIITRYDDVVAALKDVETFSSKSIDIYPLSPSLRELVPHEDDRIVRALMANQVVLTDPPQQTIIRRTAQATFTRKRVDATLDRVQALCDELVEEIAPRGEAELMADFNHRFTLRVVGDMLGLEIDDLPRFQEMIVDFFSLMVPANADVSHMSMPDEEVAARFSRIVDGYRYFATVVEDRRSAPRDDMATAMIELRDGTGAPVMTTEMILAHMIGIMAAGTDTTANLLGSAVRRLTEHPDVRDAALADPTLWPAVVEEALRRESPADKTYRLTTRDVEVRGELIRKGSTVILSFSGANGDAERFPDPLAFDINRPEITGSVTFGVGRHFCLGAPLVRPEARIALEGLFTRLDGLAADMDTPQRFAPLPAMRMREALPVTWER